MRAPSRRRTTNLPSFTARRPNVDSAMPERRQKSAILSSSSGGLSVAGTLAAGPVGLQAQFAAGAAWEAAHP
jgi:hypothetical protein